MSLSLSCSILLGLGEILVEDVAPVESIVEASLVHAASIPLFLKSGHSLGELLVVLLDVLLNNLVDIVLSPEVLPRLHGLHGGVHDVLVVHARSPVVRVHGHGGLEILAPGHVVVGVQCLDGGVHNRVLDVIRCKALHEVLGDLGAVAEVEGNSLELREQLALASVDLLDRQGFHGGKSIPLRVAHEELVEAAETLAGSAVVAEVPLKLDESHVAHDKERVSLEVLDHLVLPVLILVEAGPPRLDLSRGNLPLAIVSAALKEREAGAEGLLAVLVPLLLVSVEVVDGVVPHHGHVVVALHAVKIMVHVQAHGLLNVAFIEVGNRVALVEKQSKERHA